MNLFNVITPIAAIFLSLSSIAGEAINKSLPLNDATNVTIENLRGEVKILGNDGNQVAVKGELDDKAEEFIFEQDGSQILIKVVMPRNMRHNNWNYEGSKLTISLPSSVKVNFSGVSSDVSLSNIKENVDIQTVSGNIAAKDLSNSVNLSSVSGNIKSENVNGKVHLSTVSGDIQDKNSSGRLSIKAVSGDITTHSNALEVNAGAVSGEIYLKLAKAETLDVSSVSGDLEGSVNLVDGGLIKMSSVSGDMDIALNEDIQAIFKINANAGGKLVNRLTSDKAKKAKYGPSAKLHFSKGNGNSTVKANTVSGRVTISGH